MVEIIIIKHPYSIWIQLASLSFAMAGNFSDLLIIRLCLSSAYVFAFINCILGAPLWPNIYIPNTIQLDGMIWAILNLYVHISTVVRLLKDEWCVQLSNDELALWRMFYRTGGISQRIFQKTIARHCTVVIHDNDSDTDTNTDNDTNNANNNNHTIADYNTATTTTTTATTTGTSSSNSGKTSNTAKICTEKYFYIIYYGTVQLTVRDDTGRIISTREAQSGQIFDFRSLGMLEEDFTTTNNSSNHHNSWFQYKLEATVVKGPVKLFRFNKHQIESIASHPSTRLLWKELLMENLLRIVQRYFDNELRRNTGTSTSFGRSSPHNSTGSLKSFNSVLMSADAGNRTNSTTGKGTSTGTRTWMRIHPIFAPLEEWEVPHPLRGGSNVALKYPFQHIGAYMKWSFAPPWPFSSGPPVGLRHNQLLVGMGTKFGRVQTVSTRTKRYLGEFDSSTTTTTTSSFNSNNNSNNNNNIINNQQPPPPPQSSSLSLSSEYSPLLIKSPHTSQSEGNRSSISYNNDETFGLDEELGGINQFLGFKRATSINSMKGGGGGGGLLYK